jgi:predicted XRE-type DNA-binding protein
MNQNVFKLITNDPVEYTVKHLKSQLLMALITSIRENGWTQATAAKVLNVSAPRVSNLFQGYLEKFSIEALVEMLVRVGYKLDADFDTQNDQRPLVLNLNKSGVTDE